MIRIAQMICAVLLFFAFSAAPVSAQSSVAPAASNPSAAVPVPTIPDAAKAQPLDVKAAVDAYLAKVPAEQRARSDAYFEGGYWLILWDFVVLALVMWLMLHFRWSARMRDWAERITRFRPLQTAIYAVEFVVALSVITFPWTVYESYIREHKYGLLNQTFWPWTREQLIQLGVNTVFVAIFLVVLFA